MVDFEISVRALSFAISSNFNVSSIHHVLGFAIMTESKATMNLIPQ